MGRRSIHFLGAALLAVATTAHGQSPEETAMAQHVARSIKESGQLSNYSLGVKYQDGVAWLLGTVASQEQMETAIALAEQVPGVEQVISKLEVEAPAAGETAPAANPIESVVPNSPAALMLASAAKQSEVAPRPAQPPRQRLARNPNARPMPLPAHQANAIRQASLQQGRAIPANYCPSCPPGGGGYGAGMGGMGMAPAPSGYVPGGGGVGLSYDNAHLPGYAWPSYAAYPNYSALTYPKQYSPTAWPYIGPFYPYPQVPLGWRKVTLEWDDGWWHLDFSHSKLQ